MRLFDDPEGGTDWGLLTVLCLGILSFCLTFAQVAFVRADWGEECRPRGDANNDGYVNISDIPDLVDAIQHAPAIVGPCWEWVDVNSDGAINMADASYLLAHLFQGGPPPPDPFTCCEEK